MSIDAIASAAAGPFAAACVVLALAGAAKLRRPVGTRPAAAALGLPASPGAVRTLGGVELVRRRRRPRDRRRRRGRVVAVVYVALAVAAWRLLVQRAGHRVRLPRRVRRARVGRARRRERRRRDRRAWPRSPAVRRSPPSATALWDRVAFVLLVGCCAALVTAVLDALPALRAAMPEGAPDDRASSRSRRSCSCCSPSSSSACCAVTARSCASCTRSAPASTPMPTRARRRSRCGRAATCRATARASVRPRTSPAPGCTTTR